MNFDFKRMLKFELNQSAKEKKYRLYAGIGLVVLSVFMGDITSLLVGVILTATGFSGWCPVYSGMGKSTLEAAPAAEAASEDNA